MIFRLAVAAFLVAGSLQAQTVVEDVDAARERLAAATQRLDAARGASDRVAALTETVRAFEDGLAALRDGLRRIATQEDTLTRAIASRDEDIGALLGVLSVLGLRGSAPSLLHPDGPLETVRAGLLVSSVTPEIVSRATELRRELDRIVILRTLRESALGDLNAGLSRIQRARTELSQAASERGRLPQRFTADPERMAFLTTAARTLDDLATGLAAIETQDSAPDGARFQRGQGVLPSPVSGTLLRSYREADAAGVERPGIVVATRSQALVTAPVTATLRYRGPLSDYGLVSILEPAKDSLLILAGLATVYGDVGEVLPAGHPVGLMGGTALDIASPTRETPSTDRPETLYIEIRQGQDPVDPLDWFDAAALR